MRLTGGSQEEQHQDPVDPEEQESQEGDEGLQREQGQVDEDLPGHVEQSDGQSHPLPHEEHQQQQDHLEAGPQGLVGDGNRASADPRPYREDGGSHGVDQQRLAAAPPGLRLLPGSRPGLREGVVSREAQVDVEPPQDAGPR